MTKKHDKKCPLVQRLRFPEFNEEWCSQPLGQLAFLIKEKAGDRKCILMSIMSGVGLISQIDKFGKEIAGQQYKNYIILHKNDFAYNKSSTKDYPQGFIALYTGSEIAAVPNSIFTCFRVSLESIVPAYLNYLFLGNFHGKWIQRYITVGARAHGSLNIDDNDLLSLPIPYPKGISSLDEQQRIADCLSSLDERIAAETSKLERLKEHKKGLLGRLFPAEGETLPRLRFPEFRNEGEWEERTLGEISTITSGGTPSRSETCFWNGNIPWVTTSLIDFCVIYHADEYITNEGIKSSSTKLFPKGTVLMAMYGQGKTRGKVALLGIEAATNQACAAIILGKNLNEMFIFQNLSSRYEGIRDLSNRGGQDNLSIGLISKILVAYPKSVEQQKIAGCLSSLDELITAQTQKIDLLKDHKKGLMQQLFPRTDEVLA